MRSDKDFRIEVDDFLMDRITHILRIEVFVEQSLLMIDDIQSKPIEMTVLHSIKSSLGIHDFAAGDIDKDSMFFHMGDFIGIDEVVILALEVCHVADDDICIRKEGIDIFKLDKLLCMIGLEDIISDHFCT